MSATSEDEVPPGSPPAPEAPPSFDRTLILATVAIALIAALLLAAVLVIESGFEQLRKEAFPLTGKEEGRASTGRESEQFPALPLNDEEQPTAFLGLELQHSLASGLLSVYVDDRLVHEAPLSSRPRRVFLFRVAPQGDVRLSLPVEPGRRRITLRIRSDDLQTDAAVEASADFQENEWRLLSARLRPDEDVLEIRWAQ